MRTTVNIDDELLRAAKDRAQAHRQSLGQVIETALRRYLAEAHPEREAPAIPTFHDGTGLRPGVDLSSNRAIHELFDEETDLGRLR